MQQTFKPGDTLFITIGERAYQTVFDDKLTQRLNDFCVGPVKIGERTFTKENIASLRDPHSGFNLNNVLEAFENKQITDFDFVNIYALLNHSVSSFSGITLFEHLPISNEFWETPQHKYQPLDEFRKNDYNKAFRFPNNEAKTRACIDEGFKFNGLEVADVSYDCGSIWTWVLCTNGELWLLDKSHGGGGRFTLEQKT
jgi:hypothetical protein